MQLLVRILLPWAVIGFIVGVFGLFKFLYLADVHGPVRVYPVHVVQMSAVYMIVASLLGLSLYPIFVPPLGAVLRSFFWRIPLSAIAGLTATNMALRMIGTLGRIMPLTRCNWLAPTPQPPKNVIQN